MPGTQWAITAFGLAAAMLGFCLLAIHAHENRRQRWMLFGLLAAVMTAATVVFGLTVRPDVRVG